MKPGVYDYQKQRVSIPASSLGAPVVTYLTSEKVWVLEEPYRCEDGSTAITVAAPFRFDLASIPRELWWLVAPFELSIAAPLMHDFLYRFGGNPPPPAIEPPRTYTRKDADLLFRDIMSKEGVFWWRRAAAYRAVRLLGRGAWHGA